MNLEEKINYLFESVPVMRQIKTEDGDMDYREAVAPSWFWDLWRSEKIEVMALGVTVTKQSDQWIVRRISKPKRVYTKKEKPLEKIDIKKIKKYLLDFQFEHVENIIKGLKNYNCFVDGSRTGSGKTYISLSVCKYFNLFPIVLTRKSVVPEFERVMKNHFGIKKGFVMNYESFKANKSEYLTIDKTKKMFRGKMITDYKFSWNLPENCFFVFDEAHCLKSSTTINGKMYRSFLSKKVKHIIMSATLAKDPLDMYNIGLGLGLFQAKDYYWWLKNHGCFQDSYNVWRFTENAEKRNGYLKKIHSQIYPKKGSRLSDEDLKKFFPESIISPEVFELGEKETKKINELYDQMKDSIAEMREIKKQNKIKRAIKEGRDVKKALEAPELIVAIIQRLRQEIEIIKIPLIVELVENYLEEGNSVCIFMNFNQGLKTVSAKLNCPMIWGSNKGDERQRIIDDFQSNKIRVIALNQKAGSTGISLHDLDGNFPRVSVISPDWSATTFIQTLGRIHRAGGKSVAYQKIVYAMGTVEESVCEKVKQSVNQLSILNDGELLGMEF